MNKTIIKILSVCLAGMVITGGVGVTAYAISNKKAGDLKSSSEISILQNEPTTPKKDETVYVLAGADGSVKKIIVSDWIKNNMQSPELEDKSELNNIENVKGNENYIMNGDSMRVWDAAGNDIYYQGNIEKEIPVTINVTYQLDGKTISPQELKGKSGKVTIRYNYNNSLFKEVEIDGKKEKMAVPFVMLTGVMLDTDNFTDVAVSNGKIINDGDRIAVIGLSLPGLQNNLNISKDKLEIPDYVEITANVKKFSLETTMTLATNEIFNKIDTNKLNSVDDMVSSMDELNNAMTQLMDGSSQLYGGMTTLLTKSKELVSGIDRLVAGAAALKSGSDNLKDGTSKLELGAQSLASGLNTLKGNNNVLKSGAKQVFDTMLTTGNTQLAQAGITVPTLTAENYGTVLEGVISSLDSETVYNKVLNQVKSAVEAQRPALVSAVTGAVKQQVESSVILTATGMSKEEYEEAVALGNVPAAVQTRITETVNANMNSQGTKSIINNKVNEKIQDMVSDNMNSDEINEKLASAAAGKIAVTNLKTSLDGYNQFYKGLIQYTEGVGKAAAGAGDLKNAAYALDSGAGTLKSGIETLYNGILTMKNGAPALVNGVSELKDGTMRLSDGIKELNQEGIKKLTDAVNGDVKGLVSRVKATVDVSKSYDNFSGKSDNMDGNVKFIYRTESIKAE